MKVTTLSRNFYYMKLFWSFTTPKVKLRNRLDQGGGVQLIGCVKTLQLIWNILVDVDYGMAWITF